MYSIVSSCMDGVRRYGIQGRTITVSDITVSSAEIEALLLKCNQHNLSEVHLFDVIEDWFGQLAYTNSCI